MPSVCDISNRQCPLHSSSLENHAYCRQVSPFNAYMSQGACAHFGPAFCLHSSDFLHAAHPFHLTLCGCSSRHRMHRNRRASRCAVADLKSDCAQQRSSLPRNGSHAHFSSLQSLQAIFAQAGTFLICCAPRPLNYFSFCKRWESQQPHWRLVFPVLTCRHSMLTHVLIRTREYTDVCVCLCVRVCV